MIHDSIPSGAAEPALTVFVVHQWADRSLVAHQGNFGNVESMATILLIWQTSLRRYMAVG